jgi:P pilus assembly chaperone PapD
MFFSPSAILAFFFTLFLVGQVAAVPLPMPMAAAIERSVKRQVDLKVPSKSDGNGVVVPYKRQVDLKVPSKSDGNGIVVPYKRQVDVEVASKSDGNGVVVPYKRQVDLKVPSKSDGNGVVVPYKRDVGIPSQLAVRSIDGVIELL